MKLLTRSNLMFGFLVLIALCIIGWSGVAFAGLSGGTLGEFGKFSLGIEAESVSERDMEFEGGTWSETVYWSGNVYSYSGSLDDEEVPGCNFESNRVLLSLGIGLHPRLDLFLRAGVADAKLSDFEDEFDNDEEIKFDGDSGAAYGVGLRAKLFEIGGVGFLATAEYLQYKIDSGASQDGVDFWDVTYNPGDSSTGSAEMEVAEWEVGLVVSKKFGWFIPYAGINYSDCNTTISVDEDYLYWDGERVVSNFEMDWEQEENVGVFFGADAKLGENFSMGLSCKFMSEKSVSFQVAYAF